MAAKGEEEKGRERKFEEKKVGAGTIDEENDVNLI